MHAFTLDALVAPLEVNDLLAAIRARHITLMRGSDSARFQPLLTWESLLGVFERGAIDTTHVRVTRERHALPPMFFWDPDPAIRTAKLKLVLDQGGSVIVNRLYLAMPDIAVLADDVKRLSGERIEISAFASTGSHGALEVHFDSEDILVLQVEGDKRWRMYGPPVINPVRGMEKPSTPGTETLVFDEVLRAGDLLVVPAGYWHRCDNGAGRSFHVCIAFEPLCAPLALRALAQRLLDNGEGRQPLLRGHSTDAVAAAAQLKAVLTAHIEELSMEEFIDAHQALKGGQVY